MLDLGTVISIQAAIVAAQLSANPEGLLPVATHAEKAVTFHTSARWLDRSCPSELFQSGHSFVQHPVVLEVVQQGAWYSSG